METTAAQTARPVPAPLATIEIKNLRLRTFIGFNPEERTKQQDIVINVSIVYRADNGVWNDQVEDALNYKTITKRIIRHVESGRSCVSQHKIFAIIVRTM